MFSIRRDFVLPNDVSWNILFLFQWLASLLGTNRDVSWYKPEAVKLG